MARSVWKFKFFTKSVWRKIFKFKKSINPNYKFNYKHIHDRSSFIPNLFKGSIFKINKGMGYRNLIITKFVVGMRFGEFAFTRKPFHFPLRKKKGRKFRIN